MQLHTKQILPFYINKLGFYDEDPTADGRVKKHEVKNLRVPEWLYGAVMVF